MVHFTSGQMNEKVGLVQRRLNIIIIIIIIRPKEVCKTTVQRAVI